VIDQTKYFRQTIFGGLPWTVQGKKRVARADFALWVAGSYCGTFNLQLSHDPKWEAGQANYTTGLHWGPAVGFIKNKNLVGRPLRLYAPLTQGNPFVIEIV
jgi:hypothetical protein